MTRGELSQILGSDKQASAVLEALIGARLLVAREGEGGEDRIEVVHEALLSSWPRLVRWQREDAESVRLRDQLRAAARQWVDRDRPRGMLWRGDALLEYRVWRGHYAGSLTDAEEEFANASLAEESRGRRIRRILSLSAFAVLAVGLAVVLYLYQEANTAKAKVQASAVEIEKRASETKRLMLESYQEQGRQALLSGFPMKAYAYLDHANRERADNTALHFMLSRARQELDDQLLVLEGHQGAVHTIRFSPDGSRIATGSADKTARIWDARTGAQLTTLTGHDDRIRWLEFSGDGSKLVTADLGGTVTVWNAIGGERLFSAVHEGIVYWAGFDPRGTIVATISHDRTAKIWDAASGELLRTLEGHSKGIQRGAFSIDGTMLATGGIDRSVMIWDVRTGGLVSSREGLGGVVTDVKFSPRGELVAASAGPATAWLLPVGDGEPVVTARARRDSTKAGFFAGRQAVGYSERRSHCAGVGCGHRTVALHSQRPHRRGQICPVQPRWCAYCNSQCRRYSQSLGFDDRRASVELCWPLGSAFVGRLFAGRAAARNRRPGGDRSRLGGGQDGLSARATRPSTRSMEGAFQPRRNPYRHSTGRRGGADMGSPGQVAERVGNRIRSPKSGLAPGRHPGDRLWR